MKLLALATALKYFSLNLAIQVAVLALGFTHLDAAATSSFIMTALAFVPRHRNSFMSAVRVLCS